MKAGDALDYLFAAAPCGKGKSKGLEAIDCRLRQHPNAQETHAAFGRLWSDNILPLAPSLLLPICEHLAMERQHAKHDVFLHHAYDAILDHTHQHHMIGYDLGHELVDSGTDRKEHLQIAITRDVVRHVPGQQIPHLFRVDAFPTLVEFKIGELARKYLAENCAPSGIGIEKKPHLGTLRVTRRDAR
ncbi:hypothetical protein ACVWZV_002504 [Bradyrhizobium sp. GM5.1]